MDRSIHTMSCLFAQLGMKSNTEEIESFIASHKGLSPCTPLYKAKFWNRSQADFLQEAISEDSNWSDIVDSLDTRLR